MESIWGNGVTLPSFNELDKDTECDVLIIGGGIAGILCAYMLEKEGIDYILLESNRICGKTTKFTTAKITSLHGFIYSKLIKEFGYNFARQYYEANEEAIKEYKKLAAKIDCDFETTSNIIFTFDNEKKIAKEYHQIKSLAINAEFLKETELPFDVAGGIKFENQATFNPLKFISAISKDLNIYENSRVKKVKENFAYTDKARIKANKIVFATHFPFVDLHGFYALKMYQEKSYAIAFKGQEKIKNTYIDDQSILSVRSYNDYIILGGQKHRTGKKSAGWEALKSLKEKYFQGNNVEYMWAAEDTITLDGVPYIGKYSVFSNDRFVITGFNKWGMTGSMVGAKLICDLIMGRKNRFEKIFSPQRSIIRPQLAVNIFEAATNLITFSKPRCTHLGCKLVWNRKEHTWDCPCHGSKFCENGEILNGPANKKLDL